MQNSTEPSIATEPSSSKTRASRPSKSAIAPTRNKPSLSALRCSPIKSIK